MEFIKLLFGFRGRVGRAVYLTGFAANLVALLTAFLIVDTVQMMSGDPRRGVLWWFVFSVAGLASGVSLFALHVKRAQDRNYQWLWGVFALAMIASAIGLILGGSAIFKQPVFSLVMLPLTTPAFAVLATLFCHLGCIRGVEGANRFGSDPRDEEKLKRISV